MEQKRAKSAGSKKRQIRSGSTPNALEVKSANRSRSNDNKAAKKSSERRQSSADSFSKPFQKSINPIVQSYIPEEHSSSPPSPSSQHTIPPPWKSQSNDVCQYNRFIKSDFILFKYFVAFKDSSGEEPMKANMPTWANNPDYTVHATSSKPEEERKTVIGIFDVPHQIEKIDEEKGSFSSKKNVVKTNDIALKEIVPDNVSTTSSKTGSLEESARF